MLIALAVLAALETSAPAVDLRLSGSGAAPVSAAPRSLSDVARERREGRTSAVGGFSAVESTIPRQPVVLPATWDAEDLRREPEIAPEPQPGGEAPYVSGWGGWYGGVGGTPRRRPPHVSHFTRPVHGPDRTPAAIPLRAGGPNVTRSNARAGMAPGGSFPRP